jgi:hypothetical protein
MGAAIAFGVILIAVVVVIWWWMQLDSAQLERYEQKISERKSDSEHTADQKRHAPNPRAEAEPFAESSNSSREASTAASHDSDDGNRD